MSSDLSNKCFPPVSFSLPSWVKNEKFQVLKETFLENKLQIMSSEFVLERGSSTLGNTN